MPSSNRPDPFTNGRFFVQIDGVAASAFSEVSGLEVSIDVIDYRAGDSKVSSEQRLPGLSHASNITLKRGLTLDLSLWQWFANVLGGNVDRRDLTITLLDQSEKPVLIWRIHKAWPCKWTGPILQANSSEVAIETLEITHEGLELASVT